MRETIAIGKKVNEGRVRGVHPLTGHEKDALSAIKPVKSLRPLTGKTCIMLAFIIFLVAGFGFTVNANAAQFTVTVCTDCHTYPPADGTARNNPAGAVMGSHSAHSDASVACTICHVDTTSGETDYAHRDGNIELLNPIHSGTGAYSKGTSFAQTNDLDGSGLGSCSNIYCHSTGQSTTDKDISTPTYASPAWGTAASGACGTCHKVTEGSGLTSGSHGEHLGTTGVSGCADCHTGAENDASAYNSANHVNELIDVANTYSKTGTPGNGYGTCSAASCHDDGTGTVVATPVWGTASACTECHAAEPATGSHPNHLTNAAGHGYKRPDCGDCHGDAVESTTAPAQHLDGNLDVYDVSAGDMGYPQDEAKGGTPYSTCTTAYCHSSGQSYTDANDATPTYSSPIWGGGEVCGSCHKAETGHDFGGTNIDSGSHTKHLSYDLNTAGTGSLKCAICHKWEAAQAFGTCGQCHGTAGATIYHANGEINVFLDTEFAPRTAYGDQTGTPGNGYFSCSTVYCHSTGQSTTDGSVSTPTYSTPTWGGAAACGTCHKVTEASGLTSGSHGEHLGTAGVSGCSDCHTGAADDASSYNDLVAHVNKSIDVANTYSKGGTPGNGYGTCSTASCHDDGTGTPIITATWGSSPAACASCHAAAPATGSHTKHLSTTNYNTADCADCHESAVQGTTAPAQHLDDNIDVYDTASGDLGYTENKTKGSAYTTCTTAYCHSTGQSTSDGSSSTPAYASVTWGGTAACGTCHKVTEASGLTSGSHAAHLGTTGVSGCSDCHTGTANNASAYNSTTHIDASIDVANTYTAGGTPGNGYGTCSTASCHDNGTGTMVISSIWGSSPAECSECHAVAPTTGSHTIHLAASGVACNDCHESAVQGTTAPAQHIDGNIDVFDTASGDLGYTQNKAKSTAYTTCSTASCHSNGLGTYRTTPIWGTSGTTCNECHNALPTTGSHSKHVSTAATAYGSTAVSSTSGNYDFGCGNCHPVVESGNHKNGTLDITLNSTHGGTLKLINNVSDNASGYVQSAGTSVTCSASYCHSDENGTFATTPEWYGGTFAGDVCANCHDNSPATGSHSGHAVGIHYDTLFSGTSGLMTASGVVGSGAAHGDPNTSTTISCNICHNSTVTVSRNDNNAVCNTCHDAEGNAIAGSDLDKTVHINGTVNVAFANVTIRSKAQVRDDITTVTELNTYWSRNNNYKVAANSNDSSKATLNSTANFSSGTCSTVACHNGNSVTWGDSISCDACHTGLP